MALTFTGTGGMFTRIGKMLKVGYTLTPYEAGIPALFDEIFNQYLTSLENVGGAVQVQADQATRIASGVMGFITQTAGATVQGMVLADQGSQSTSVQQSLQETIRQMKVGGYYVTPNAIGVSQAALPNFTGNGVLVMTTKRGDGLVQENSIPEVLRVTCTADSYTGGATQGREQFGVAGQPASAGTWDYDYPTGSGAAQSATAVSSSEDANTSGNLLTNGDFEGWTGSGPTSTLDYWTLGTGAWGTDIQQNTTDPNLGTYALEFVAGTATATTLYQEFGDTTTGTAATMTAYRSYAVNLWLRKLSGTISAGVLRVALVDDSGTVLNDGQGVANSFDVTLSGLTTSYVAYNGTFRLDADPPAVVRLQLRLTTNLAGGNVLADDICLAPVTNFYQGGPGFAVFSGATPFVTGDAWNVTVTNDYGGASYLGTFQTGFDRIFNMKALNLLLPSTGSNLIANTLITA